MPSRYTEEASWLGMRASAGSRLQDPFLHAPSQGPLWGHTDSTLALEDFLRYFESGHSLTGILSLRLRLFFGSAGEGDGVLVVLCPEQIKKLNSGEALPVF